MRIDDGLILNSNSSAHDGLGFFQNVLDVSGSVFNENGYLIFNNDTNNPMYLTGLKNPYSGIFIQISGTDEDYVSDGLAVRILGSKPQYSVSYAYNDDYLSNIDVFIIGSTRNIDTMKFNSGYIGYANQLSGENLLNSYFDLSGLNGLQIASGGTGVFKIITSSRVPKSMFLESAVLPLKIFTNYGEDQLLVGLANTGDGSYVPLSNSDASFLNKIRLFSSEVSTDASGYLYSVSLRVLTAQPTFSFGSSSYSISNISGSGNYSTSGPSSFSGLLLSSSPYLYTLPQLNAEIFSYNQHVTASGLSGNIFETKRIASSQTKYYRDLRFDLSARVSMDGVHYTGQSLVTFSGNGCLTSGVISISPNVFRGFDCNFFEL